MRFKTARDKGCRHEPRQHRILFAKMKLASIDAQRIADPVILEICLFKVQQYAVGKAHSPNAEVMYRLVGKDRSSRTEIVICKGRSLPFNGRAYGGCFACRKSRHNFVRGSTLVLFCCEEYLRRIHLAKPFAEFAVNRRLCHKGANL